MVVEAEEDAESSGRATKVDEERREGGVSPRPTLPRGPTSGLLKAKGRIKYRRALFKKAPTILKHDKTFGARRSKQYHMDATDFGIVQERSVMRYPGGRVDSNGRDSPDGFGICFF